MSQAYIVATPRPLGNDASQSLETLVDAGLPLDAAMQLRISVDFRPDPEAARFFPIAFGQRHTEGRAVAGPDVDLPSGIVAALWLDGVLSTLSFAESTALLVRARNWLCEGGTLIVDEYDIGALAEQLMGDVDTATRQHAVEQMIDVQSADGWFAGKVHWVLSAFGFQVQALERRRGTKGLIVHAEAQREGDEISVVEAARHLLGEVARNEAHFTSMWNVFSLRTNNNVALVTSPEVAAMTPVALPKVTPVALPAVTPVAGVAEVAEPAGVVVPETAPKASIIVLTYNGIEDTQLCLESVVSHTHVAHEIIVVDNASSDGTPDYLRSFAAEHPNVRLVLNDENLGFSGGNNLGMAISRGRYVVLLNNDTVVTDGWVSRMIDAVERAPGVGLVGPRSNCVSGPQLVHPVPYRDLDAMHAYATRFTEAHLGQAEGSLRLVGFCLMVTREVIDTIGGLDERYGRGNFEDDDWCLRAHLHGFGACIAHDVFIHHGGSKAFRREGIDYKAQITENWEIFKAKWGIDPDRRLEQGYPETFHPPEEVMDFIPLPNIETDHTHNPEGRIWESAPATPSQANPTTDDINRLFDDAEAAAQKGDWGEAAQIFNQMIEIAPNFGPGYVGLASAALATGQIEPGIAALEHACRIYPDQCGLRVQLAVAFAHTGKLERSQETFLEVLDIDPDHKDALVSLAQLCRAAGNYVAGVELLGHAARVHPDAPEVVGAIGMMALELGDRNGAISALQRLQEVAPDHDEVQILADAIRTPQK